MKIEFSRKSFEKYANINFREYPSSDSGSFATGRTNRRRTDRQTDTGTDR